MSAKVKVICDASADWSVLALAEIFRFQGEVVGLIEVRYIRDA